MRLVQLFESDNRSIAFCFGRMNPPTIGHAAVFDALAKTSKDYRIFVSPAQTPKKKNPLDFDTKLKFLKAMFPQHAPHISSDSSINTIYKAAALLYSQGYRSVTVVGGSDRAAFKDMLEKYNGVNSAHGFYDFKSINFVSSGDRDPDADGLTAVSGTAAREAAVAGDEQKFKEITGAGKYAGQLYAAVKAGLGMKEDSAGSGGAGAGAGGGAAGGEAAGVGIITKQNSTKDVNKGSIRKNLKAWGLTKKEVSEAPIEMDPADPMDPMIYGHEKANPAKLKYRMLRAMNQLKDLAARADNASSAEWQMIARDFKELSMNIEQIRHALEELGKLRSKGGIKSRGIDPMLDHIVKVKGGYELKSKKTGKNLGKYLTRAGAEKRERQVQYFKHKG